MKKRQAALVRGKPPVVSMEDVQQKIRQRAYELYELRGRADGRDFDDWIEAELEVIGKASIPSADPVKVYARANRRRR